MNLINPIINITQHYLPIVSNPISNKYVNYVFDIRLHIERIFNTTTQKLIHSLITKLLVPIFKNTYIIFNLFYFKSSLNNVGKILKIKTFLQLQNFV